MSLYEKEITIPAVQGHNELLEYISGIILEQLPARQMPVRFVITRTDEKGYHCELGILSEIDDFQIPPRDTVFDFRKRSSQNIDQFNAVLLIPTGIGAEIGGHSGDAGPVARLLASACDNLITHPNVVNASDINELPENGLYVEGSVITCLLMGTVGLEKIRSNRVMLVIDKHQDEFFHESAINSVSAARAAFGLSCPVVVKMDDKILMRSLYSSSGRAVGTIDYLERLFEILIDYRPQYDAVALSSVIKVPSNFHKDYFLEDMVNPWGGVEAMLTHAISILFNIPSAHSPMMESRAILDLDVGVVDPRKAAEAVSVTYLNCILKGLHKSPKIITEPSALMGPGVLTVADIDCVVIPDRCVGLPTLAAIEQEIPVIAVKENKNNMKNDLSAFPFQPEKLIYVDNYLEAAGIMTAMKAGVAPETVRRPMSNTIVIQESHCSKMETNYQHKKDGGKEEEIIDLPSQKEKEALES